jgi:hypothetical protein
MINDLFGFPALGGLGNKDRVHLPRPPTAKNTVADPADAQECGCWRQPSVSAKRTVFVLPALHAGLD